MKTKLQFLFFFGIATYILTSFSSCIAREDESLNVYFLNNQSSHDLIYSIPGTEVPIEKGATKEISSTVALGGLYLPSWQFNGEGNNISGHFLFRESMGVNIEALMLDTIPDILWEDEEVRREIHVTLVVTDELIK